MKKVLITSLFWIDSIEDSKRYRNACFVYKMMQNLNEYLNKDNNIHSVVKFYDFSPKKEIEGSIHIPYQLDVFKKSEKLNLILKENYNDYDFIIMHDADCFFNKTDYPYISNLIKNMNIGNYVTFDTAKLFEKETENVIEHEFVDMDIDWHFAYSGLKSNGPLYSGHIGAFGGIYISDIKLIVDSGGFDESLETWGKEDNIIISQIYNFAGGNGHIIDRNIFPFHLAHESDWDNILYRKI